MPYYNSPHKEYQIVTVAAAEHICNAAASACAPCLSSVHLLFLVPAAPSFLSYHALPLSILVATALLALSVPAAAFPATTPPPHTQASIARRILSKWGQGYADFSGKDDLALIADLSGLNGAKITLAGVTYDQLELALDGSEVYGFRQGVELFTAIADARVFKRVKKVPLLGVAHDVSGTNGGVESGGPKMGEQGIPCLRRRGSGGKGGREKGSKGGREGSMRKGEGARDGAHRLGTEGEGGCKHGGCVKRGPL